MNIHKDFEEFLQLLNDEEVWNNRNTGLYGAVRVNFISYKDLLKNKKESGRPRDIADFDELGGNRDK